MRIGIHDDRGLTWWLTGEFNWSPTDESDTELLRRAALRDLDPLEHTTFFSFGLGLSFL